MTESVTHNLRTRLVAPAALFLTLLLAAPALAQDGAPAGDSTRDPGEVSKITSEVSQEVYSPFCPGKTLAMCPSGGASEVRQEIQNLARDGKSKAEIKDAIVDKYGEEYRMVEPPSQDNYTLLGILAGAFVLCIFAIWFLAGRGRGRRDELSTEPGTQSPPPAEEDLSDEEKEYLEQVRGEYMD